MKQDGEVPDRIIAETAATEGAETFTVLDYLWEGQQGSAFEPVDPAPVDPQQPAKSRLDSALRSYSSWLDSISHD
ncbi:MAG TPA: hypothetical protein VIU46_11390 [Gallionellaceae bacterium]